MEGNGESFASYVERERARLDGEVEAIRQQQRELDGRLDAVNAEMHAIDAYERAKSGRAPMARQGRGDGRGRQSGGGRRGSRREELLNVIREGRTMSRGEILEKMGLKNDKQGSMSVSNALTSLIKNGQLRREAGKYSVAA